MPCVSPSPPPGRGQGRGRPVLLPMSPRQGTAEVSRGREPTVSKHKDGIELRRSDTLPMGVSPLARLRGFRLSRPVGLRPRLTPIIPCRGLIGKRTVFPLPWPLPKGGTGWRRTGGDGLRRTGGDGWHRSGRGGWLIGQVDGENFFACGLQKSCIFALPQLCVKLG